MELAENKFKNLTLKKKRNAPSPEEEKILALEAKLNTDGDANPGPNYEDAFDFV